MILKKEMKIYFLFGRGKKKVKRKGENYINKKNKILLKNKFTHLLFF
jgi:hypothetical protein